MSSYSAPPSARNFPAGSSGGHVGCQRQLTSRPVAAVYDSTDEVETVDGPKYKLGATLASVATSRFGLD